MGERWVARHKGGALATLNAQQVHEEARKAGFETVWLDDGQIRIGDWTITREVRS